MTKNTPSFAGLQAAVNAEVRLVREHVARYEQVTKKLVEYQAGLGEAPTVQEFTLWCKDVELALAIRKLHQAEHCATR